MRKAIAILAVLSLVAFAGQTAVNLDPINNDGDMLQYDNGTPHWVTWGGTYRGVWFNIEDFIPGMSDGFLEQSEFWFYHSDTYPWDTSDVYLEVWSGDANGPGTQLHQEMGVALDYAPIFVTYPDTTCVVEANFWTMANVEMSSGGWPSSLVDWDGSAIAHSFISDDLIVWEPYQVDALLSNFFMRVEWSPLDNAFASSTWGSLKTTF